MLSLTFALGHSLQVRRPKSALRSRGTTRSFGLNKPQSRFCTQKREHPDPKTDPNDPAYNFYDINQPFWDKEFQGLDKAAQELEEWDQFEDDSLVNTPTGSPLEDSMGVLDKYVDPILPAAERKPFDHVWDRHVPVDRYGLPLEDEDPVDPRDPDDQKMDPRMYHWTDFILPEEELHTQVDSGVVAKMKDFPQFAKVILKEHEDLMHEYFRVGRYDDIIYHFPSVSQKYHTTPTAYADMADLFFRSLSLAGFDETRISHELHRLFYNQQTFFHPSTWGLVMHAYARKGTLAPALMLHKIMYLTGGRGDAGYFNSFIHLFSNTFADPTEVVLKLIKLLYRHGNKPNETTLDRVMLTFVNLERHDLAIQFYKQFVNKDKVKPTKIALSLYSECCLKFKLNKKADWAIRRLRDMEMTPRLRTYNDFIKHYLEQGRWQWADAVIRELRYAGYQPNLTTYKHYLRYFGENVDAKGVAFALQPVYEEKMMPDLEFFEIMMQYYYTTKDWDNFISFFQMCLDRHMKPARRFFTMKLEMWSHNPENLPIMMTEYNWLRQSGTEPTYHEFRLVLQAFYTWNRADSAKAFIENELPYFGGKMSSYDYLMLIHLWGEVHHEAEVEGLFEQYLNSGLKDVEPLVEMLRFVMTNPDPIAKAKALWEAISGFGAPTIDAIQQARVAHFLRPVIAVYPELADEVAELFFTEYTSHVSSDFFLELLTALAPLNHEKMLVYYKLMRDQFKLPTSKEILHQMMLGLTMGIQKTRDCKLLIPLCQIAKDGLLQLNIYPMTLDFPVAFSAALISHGNQRGFEVAMRWFKDMHSGQAQPGTVNHENLIQMRNDLRLMDDFSIFVPDEYEARSVEFHTKMLADLERTKTHSPQLM